MADGSHKMTEATSSKEEEPFQAVKTRSKRKLEQDEDMEKDKGKSRPSFPPVKAQKLSVSVEKMLLCVEHTHVVLKLYGFYREFFLRHD